MKQIIVILLFIISSAGVSAQEKIYQELIQSFITLELVGVDDPEFPDIIRVRKHLHWVINTDSVYSFFQADIFKPLKNVRIIANDYPISKDTVIKNIRIDEYYILDVLSNLYYAPDNENGIIPPRILREMVYAVIDSTTQYTQPIYNWDISRMSEIYIEETTMHKVIVPFENYAIEEDMEQKKRKRKTHKLYSKIYSKFMAPAIHLKMSLPVFDKEYQYALFFFIEGQYKECSFAIFERQNGNWNPIFVTKGKDSTLLSNDFKYYGWKNN